MYKLEKLSDDVFNGNHPNMIFSGMVWSGHFYKKPIVGDRFRFGTEKDHYREHLLTSTVTEVISDTVFKTRNSTYSLIKINY